MKQNTIIIPIIRPDSLGRLLDTLYAYTKDFYVFVIDQTGDETAFNEYNKLTHLWIKSYRNLGFSKAMNTGIRLADTPYITLANDDVEIISERWWQGILDTFAMNERIIAVNPMSPREGAFGYGLTAENSQVWQPPEGFVRDSSNPDFVLPDMGGGVPFAYKKEYTDAEYQWLLDKHPRWQKNTTCDGLCMWFTVFKKESFEKIGLLDERFYPGSGEDYDMCGRAYSCAWPWAREVCDPKYHYRMVSSTKSWVWHHWSSSKDFRMKNLGSSRFDSRPSWNNLSELWPDGFDCWGHANMPDGSKKPYKRVPDVFIDEL